MACPVREQHTRALNGHSLGYEKLYAFLPLVIATIVGTGMPAMDHLLERP